MFIQSQYVECYVEAVQRGVMPIEQAAKQLMAFMSMNHRMSTFCAVPAPETQAQLELYRAVVRESLGSAQTRELIARVVSIYS